MAQGAYLYSFESRRTTVSQTQERRQRVQTISGNS